ncbi:hypothetical protein SAY86_024015 [Trapa natans]|uniref:RING-type E3 ubiquitin transferase n=1 Tax=Trapa natans TaxID=22666 RepID=A0AAN7R9V2_TRANT|nr:hypothetical protein SAY86_024015 [Trapa natans]
MLFRTVDFVAWILREVTPVAPSSDHQDDDLIRFSIFYKNYTSTPMMDGPAQETTSQNIHCKLTGQNFISRKESRYLRRSQLISFPDSHGVKLALTSMTATLFIDIWVEAIVEHLTRLTRLMGMQLSNICEQQVATAIPLEVEVTILIETVIKPEEGSHPSLMEYFQQMEADGRGIDDATVYEWTILSSSSLRPRNHFEIDDCCAICKEEYTNKLVNHNASSTSDGSANQGHDIVMTPCSHTYHYKCIMEWLQVKYECPLCRFVLPHHDEVIVMCPPEIYVHTL